MVRGDQYYMAVCNKTGTIAIYNPDKNLFLSPMSDGPLKFSRSPEGEPILDVFSRFGRSFSLLRVPYALKLLIQELQVLNIQMRIITEENVDQLLNLSYQSKNLNKLMNIADTDFKDIGELTTHYKKQLDDKVKNASHKNVEKLNKKAGLELNLKNMELQKFEGINIPNSADKEDADKHDAEKREFAKEINDLGVNNKWDNNAPNAGPWEPQNEFPSSSSTA
jgi:DNA-directed RNA polymerase II subunit RPB2